MEVANVNLPEDENEEGKDTQVQIDWRRAVSLLNDLSLEDPRVYFRTMRKFLISPSLEYNVIQFLFMEIWQSTKLSKFLTGKFMFGPTMNSNRRKMIDYIQVSQNKPITRVRPSEELLMLVREAVAAIGKRGCHRMILGSKVKEGVRVVVAKPQLSITLKELLQTFRNENPNVNLSSATVFRLAKEVVALKKIDNIAALPDPLFEA